MELSKEIIQKILDKAGLTMNSPAVGNRLSELIQAETGERLGVNTIKRLIGIYDDNCNPRRYTLEVIAHYLGYKTCDELLKNTEIENSEFLDEKSNDIICANLKLGTLITLKYCPNRKLMLRYEDNEQFIVVSSENSKLVKGDLCSISHIRCGFPLYATNVTRGEQNLGRYIAGEDGGVTILEVL